MNIIKAGVTSRDEGYVREIRRELHAHPELSGRETQTRARIVRELEAIGAEVTLMSDCCGVMGVLRHGEGRCVAVRADMDALPIQEPEGLAFASLSPGVMHACGHDVHMALALGNARYLAQHPQEWQGEVRFLFEPMEETEGGARLMAAAGCMQGVDAVLGQHVNPQFPAGTFFCRPGYVSGASDEVTLFIHGKSCHGAYPERGTDAVVAASETVLALQTLISRTLSPFDAAALSFGIMEGGTARNVVCDLVTLKGTLRTLSDEVRKGLHEGIRRTVEHVCLAHGAEGETVIRPGYGPVYNDDALYPVAEACAEAVMGKEHVIRRDKPSLGVESMCYFLEKAPGVYYDIGSGVGTALHTDTFFVDEACLASGLALQAGIVLTWLGGC